MLFNDAFGNDGIQQSLPGTGSHASTLSMLFNDAFGNDVIQQSLPIRK